MFALLGSLVAGWFVADMLGGLFHAFIDHVADANWPVISGVVRDFREHHDNGLSMEQYSRWPSLVMSGAAGVPFLALALFGVAPLFGLTVFAGLCLTQHAHYYSHTPAPPLWARILQQLGIFLSAECHARHHNNFYRSYGVLNGWSHGAVDLMFGRIYQCPCSAAPPQAPLTSSSSSVPSASPSSSGSDAAAVSVAASNATGPTG